MKSAEAVKDADAAVKDEKAKDGEAPAAPGDKDKPAEDKGVAEHMPYVAVLEAKATLIYIMRILFMMIIKHKSISGCYPDVASFCF